ncbi:MAG: putative Ig domain-containing protein [Thermodesulfovibrionales bacterium]
MISIVLISCEGIDKKQISKEDIEKAEEENKEVQIKDIQGLNIFAQPEIFSVKLSPSSPVIGDIIKAEVLSSDNTSVIYQWAKNEDMLSETSNTLSTSEFKRGDKISLTVTPFDNKQKGKPVTVFTYIFNSSPQIKSSIKDSKYSGKNFTYQVNATDADGDQLTYSLKSAPDGMTINPSTGFIQWNVPPEFKGNVPIVIAVTDGHGGEAVQRFTLEITPEKM